MKPHRSPECPNTHTPTPSRHSDKLKFQFAPRHVDEVKRCLAIFPLSVTWTTKPHTSFHTEKYVRAERCIWIRIISRVGDPDLYFHPPHSRHGASRSKWVSVCVWVGGFFTIYLKGIVQWKEIILTAYFFPDLKVGQVWHLNFAGLVLRRS